MIGEEWQETEMKKRGNHRKQRGKKEIRDRGNLGWH